MEHLVPLPFAFLLFLGALVAPQVAFSSTFAAAGRTGLTVGLSSILLGLLTTIAILAGADSIGRLWLDGRHHGLSSLETCEESAPGATQAEAASESPMSLSACFGGRKGSLSSRAQFSIPEIRRQRFEETERARLQYAWAHLRLPPGLSMGPLAAWESRRVVLARQEAQARVVVVAAQPPVVSSVPAAPVAVPSAAPTSSKRQREPSTNERRVKPRPSVPGPVFGWQFRPSEDACGQHLLVRFDPNVMKWEKTSSQWQQPAQHVVEDADTTMGEDENDDDDMTDLPGDEDEDDNDDGDIAMSDPSEHKISHISTISPRQSLPLVAASMAGTTTTETGKAPLDTTTAAASPPAPSSPPHTTKTGGHTGLPIDPDPEMHPSEGCYPLVSHCNTAEKAKGLFIQWMKATEKRVHEDPWYETDAEEKTWVEARIVQAASMIELSAVHGGPWEGAGYSRESFIRTMQSGFGGSELEMCMGRIVKKLGKKGAGVETRGLYARTMGYLSMTFEEVMEEVEDLM